MDAYEATRIVFSRIQSLDPENAAKIMGLLLIQDHGEKEMIRLAFGPETLLHSVILKARKELSLLPSTPSTPSSPSPYLSRQNSSSRLLGVTLPTTYTIPSPSSSPSTSWVSSSPSPFSRNGLTDSLQNQNQLSDVANIVSSSTSSSATSVYSDLIDESQLQDQLSFLNDSNSTTIPLSHKTNELFYPELGDLRSTSVGSESVLPYSTSNWGDGNRCSLGADLFEAIGSGFGWKPCLYFARGYCKNGASCRFLHGLPDSPETTAKMEMMEQYQELLKKSHQNQRLNSSSQLMSSSFPFSSASGKCMNFLLQQQHSDAQRAAAALMFGDESHKFGRTRLEKYEFAGTGGMINPGSRQIYLTFPADSTFREEDVSNYFSIYGPVQDVRIPYQQKRMFGFVTFVYAETVKLILAKGNPHFVCDARVLVKPYKEKGKVPDKYRKQQQQIERGDFSTCTTPTSVDSRDSYDIQLGARLFYNAQELLIKKKLEEQAELQHAIELQGRRFTNLQLPDHLKKRSVSIPSEDQTQNLETTLRQDKCLGQTLDIEQSAAAFNVEKESAVSINAAGENSNTTESQFQESVEHNLPDSPFASPTKLQLEDPSSLLFSASSATSVGSSLPEKNNMSSSSPLFSTTSTLDMSSFKPCFFQIPRFSSGHGAIGM